MKKVQTVLNISAFVVSTFFSCQPNDKQTISQGQTDVKIVGAMRNVMHKGELFGTIALDTISNKQHLYGLGPLENLSGEILIIDGRSYKSTVIHDSAMQVTETYSIKAPFFVYANINTWSESPLPDGITTLTHLENYLDSITLKASHPFCFRLSATVDSASIHIVNLQSGAKVTSPEEVHQEQKDYVIENKEVEMVGFFSTEHQGVFTHHDSFVHIHLITADRKQMGHLFGIKIKPGMAKLFLPKAF